MKHASTRSKHGFLIVLACAVGACSDGDEHHGVELQSSNTDAGTDFGYMTGLPLVEPEALRSEQGVLEVELVSEPVSIDVSGASVLGTVYNGAFVGPTLRLAPGESLHLALVNRLEQHTNIHYHGMHVSPSGVSDNIFLMVHSGETQDYVVDVPDTHEPGTFWYHSHMHMDSESQVFGGLSGVLIVEGFEQRLPEAYRGVAQRVLALKDLQVEDGAIVADNIDSNAPTVRTVNGLVEPVLEMRAGETQLWRIANIGADIFYDVAFAARFFTVIAEDGTPVERPFTAQDLVMPPGKRFDVLVTAPTEPDSYVFETVSYDQGGDRYPRKTLMTVTVSGDPVDPLPPLTAGLMAPPASDQAPVAQRRQFVFSGDDTTHNLAINGMPFDMDRIDAQPKLGTVEEWTLKNVTSEQHPFHIHVNDFKVLSVNGVPYAATGEQDTVILPPEGEVVVRIAFLDFTGKFVFHCHILGHEDGGMMATVEVVP
jgi:FtsP/CotA-like multicopper oxidase with cupredoxin domain